MPITVADILTAAMRFYDQAKLVKHNSELASFLTSCVESLVKNVSEVDARVPGADLGEANQWIHDCQSLLERIGDHDSLESYLKSFLYANGYKQEIDDLFRRLLVILAELANQSTNDISIQQERYFESMMSVITEIRGLITQHNDESLATQLNEMLAQQTAQLQDCISHLHDEHHKSTPGLILQQEVGSNVEVNALDQSLMPLTGVPKTAEGFQLIGKDRAENRKLIQSQGGLSMIQKVGSAAKITSHMSQAAFPSSFEK
jgi:hypothetical protein